MIVPTQPAAPRTLRSAIMLRCLLRLLRTIRVLCCMCRFCHALLLRRLARSTPACFLLLMLVLCLRCLLFLRLPLLLRTLPFRPILRPVLCPFAGIQRAPGPSLGPDPATTLHGTGAAIMHRVMAAMPLLTISAGGSLTPTPATHDAFGSKAAARIAAEVLAIAQGVADAQADLEILRNGVSDIAETLDVGSCSG